MPTIHQHPDSRDSQSRVVPMRRGPSPRNCVSCGYPLSPNSPTSWSRCKKCFAGALLYRAIKIFQESDG